MLAVSLDGRLAPAEGGAAQIGGAADRQVLEESLAWADACLIGGRTLRIHGTSCLIRSKALLDSRSAANKRPQPIAIVASRRGAFSPTLPFFQQPFERWLACCSPSSGMVLPLEGFHRQFKFAGWKQLLMLLCKLGITRLAVLGGAQLAGELLAAQLIDELQLTICPLLLGGPHTWLPFANGEQQVKQKIWYLRNCIQLDDDHVMLRYRQSMSESGEVL